MNAAKAGCRLQLSRHRASRQNKFPIGHGLTIGKLQLMRGRVDLRYRHAINYGDPKFFIPFRTAQQKFIIIGGLADQIGF